MRGARRWGALAAGVAVAVAVVGTTGGSAAVEQRGPIVIGWAFDSKGNMALFDGPALAAAKIHVKNLNAKGGRQIRIETCDTNNNNPARAKSCARTLLGRGADIMFVTCDVDFATPVVQEAINRGKLAIAPCIGTDQMGPKRFGKKGKLAFSFGNAAQDEGSAMAEYAIRRGWKTAGLGTNTLLVYFKNVVTAFEKRYEQLGGQVVAKESYATGANNVQAAVSRLNQKRASVYGDDPSAAVRKLAKQVKAGTGGFVTGPAAIDGVLAAIKRAGGSTKGAALAAQMEKFKRVPTISGRVSFSKQLHTVFGRQYRVIEVQSNKGKRVGVVTAKVVPKI